MPTTTYLSDNPIFSQTICILSIFGARSKYVRALRFHLQSCELITSPRLIPKADRKKVHEYLFRGTKPHLESSLAIIIRLTGFVQRAF